MKIQHKRSAALDGGKAKEPTALQTEYGELCVNFSVEDPALFIKDKDNNIVRVGGDLSLYQKIEDVPSATVVCPPSEIDTLSPPDTRGEGSLWWNTEDGILYVWYEDADSSQWVITVPQGGGAGGDVPPGTTVGTAPPLNPEVGQLWWNSDDAENGGGRLYVYYHDGNTAQWVDTSVPGGIGFSGDYNDLENKPNIPDGFDLEDGSEVNNLIVWRSEGEALTLEISGTDALNPPSENITYTDMPTTATSGSGTGMTITYDAASNGVVSNPVVSFPGSGYKPGDTFTVDDRGFGGSILTTSADAAEHPGPNGTSGWYPEAGQNYYVSTRIDSQVKSTPTFEAGFIGGRPGSSLVQPQDGAYNLYATGNRNNVYINLTPKSQTIIRHAPKNTGYGGFSLVNAETKSNGSFVERCKLHIANTNVAKFIFNDTDDNPSGSTYITRSEIQFTNNGNEADSNKSWIGQGSDERNLKFHAPNNRYRFESGGRDNDLEIKTGDGVLGLYTAITTASMEYGVHHASNKTVSLKNSVGEIRLSTSGDTRCLKGANELVIAPGGTTASTTVKGSAALVVTQANRSTRTSRIGADTVLELEADDPVAYQTTYALDEEGIQFEQQEYIGETETLLEIIRDLRARLAALEGA